MIAIITNSFMPCNGRYPTMIAVITMFLISNNKGILSSLICALILVLIIVLGIVMTFIVNKFLSKMSNEYLENNNNKRKVIDYIAGMTDSFLEAQYDKLK